MRSALRTAIVGRISLSLCLFVVGAGLAGCGTGDDEEERPVTQFPDDRLAGFSDVGQSAQDEAEGDTSNADQNKPGFGYVEGENEFHLNSEQVNVIDNQVSVLISGTFVGTDGTTRILQFTFATIGKSFPAEYELSTDPQNLSAETALVAYSETTSSDTPLVAQAVANAFLRVENYNDTKLKGTFAMDASMPDDAVRSIGQGSFDITR